MMETSYRDHLAEKISGLGITGLTLTLLEGLSPVRYLFAQLLLAATPFIPQSNQDFWSQFASMLEDPAESRKLAGTLREKWT